MKYERMNYNTKMNLVSRVNVLDNAEYNVEAIYTIAENGMKMLCLEITNGDFRTIVVVPNRILSMDAFNRDFAIKTLINSKVIANVNIVA